MNWRSHFANTDLLTIEQAAVKYPNAPRVSRGCAFISHSGIDEIKIRNEILPTVANACADNLSYIFMHNSRMGGADSYKQLVLLALTNCSYAVIAASTASVRNDWVRAEVDWLLDHHKPLAVCRIDGSDPQMLHPRLSFHAESSTNLFDFRDSIPAVREKLFSFLSIISQYRSQ